MKKIVTSFLLINALALTILVLVKALPLNFYNKAEEPKYHSQCGQDSYINKNFFPNKKDGVYVEIGAHNGLTFSNSLFFEQLGWRGMCIEPIAEEFENLRRNRNEKCICINGAIADFSGKGRFLYAKGSADMLSGLIDKYDPRHLEIVKASGSNGEFIERDVDCFKLNDLLEKHNMYHVDYLSIDTEGGELDILKTIDFSKFDIDVITIEDNYGYPEIRTLMREKGFVLITYLSQDLLYRNKKYCS